MYVLLFKSVDIRFDLKLQIVPLNPRRLLPPPAVRPPVCHTSGTAPPGASWPGTSVCRDTVKTSFSRAGVALLHRTVRLPRSDRDDLWRDGDVELLSSLRPPARY
jgi:hypothetical protein